jgi:hypothetical protein
LRRKDNPVFNFVAALFSADFASGKKGKKLLNACKKPLVQFTRQKVIGKLPSAANQGRMQREFSVSV